MIKKTTKLQTWGWGGILLLLMVGYGCENGGYSTESLYRTEIRTVFVPIFESQSFRRGAEFEVTGAVSRLIELHTPYKVVSNRGEADSILYGRINVAEQVLTQQPSLDRPLENQIVVAAQVTWKDLRTGDLLMDNQPYRISGDYAALLSAGPTSAVREAANELAQRIVETMEKPW